MEAEVIVKLGICIAIGLLGVGALLAEDEILAAMGFEGHAIADEFEPPNQPEPLTIQEGPSLWFHSGTGAGGPQVLMTHDPATDQWSFSDKMLEDLAAALVPVLKIRTPSKFHKCEFDAWVTLIGPRCSSCGKALIDIERPKDVNSWMGTKPWQTMTMDKQRALFDGQGCDHANRCKCGYELVVEGADLTITYDNSTSCFVQHYDADGNPAPCPDEATP